MSATCRKEFWIKQAIKQAFEDSVEVSERFLITLGQFAEFTPKEMRAIIKELTEEGTIYLVRTEKIYKAT